MSTSRRRKRKPPRKTKLLRPLPPSLIPHLAPDPSLKRTLPPLPEKPEGLSMKAERFLAEMVTPHQDGFHSSNLLEIAYDLVMILDEHGSVPRWSRR